MSQKIVKSNTENLDLTLNEMELDEIEDKICSQIKILMDDRKNQPIKPVNSGMGSEKVEDWMYFANCPLCKYEGLLRIDFPVCTGCRRDIGHEDCIKIHQDCKIILKLEDKNNG